MAAAHHHPHALHLAHYILPECRQTIVVILAPPAGKVVPVVRKKHPANTQGVICTDERQLISDCVRSLDVKANTKSPCLFRQVHVRRSRNQHVVIVNGHPASDRSERLEVVSNVHFAEPDIQRDDIYTSLTIAAKFG